MARKKIELFINVDNEKEFENALDHFKNKLICAEIYCGFSGYCTALDRLFTRIKLDWAAGKVELIRVLADDIPALTRLHNQSEPFYMFIVNKRVTEVFRGVNCMRFEEVVRRELNLFLQEKQGVDLERRTYELNEPLPGEIAWLNARAAEKQIERTSLALRHEARQAERKKHRAVLMAPHLKDLDFVLYWPHATPAHPELYERWDENHIIMIAREEIELTKEQALDVLYSGDAPLNEASITALLSGKALAICLRSLDSVDMVALVRKILYENDVHQSKDSEKSTTKLIPTSAYDYYKTFSPTREQIWQNRREERILKKEEEREKRHRRFLETQRLAQIAREEAIEAKKAARELKKMELLKAGKLDEIEALKNDNFDPEDVDVIVPEEDSYVSEEESEIEEDPDEYFPPPGLPIPGFYSPPNDIAKANGLAVLFPNLVSQHVTPQNEFLPPHVLVMLHMYKRHKVIGHMTPHRHALIHMGIFKITSTLPNAQHISYSVKQFDAMDLHTTLDEYKLCFMVSTKVDIPLLEFMDFNPFHVSRDTTAGEDECAALFPVEYGDDYPEFEDFEEKQNEKK